MATLHSPRTALLVGLSMAALGGAAVAVWRVTNDGHDKTVETAAKDSEQPDRTVAVRVFEVKPSREASARQLTGSVRPRYQTDVAFRVSGKILRRHIEVGDRVKAGQLLFELDPQDYQLQLKSSEANLQSEKAAVLQSIAEEKRLKELRRNNAVSASEYDKGLSDRDVAIAKQASAQKQLELAQNQLGYCRLLADTDGTVTSVSAEAGQVVTLGTPVCTIAQLQELEAVIDIPENHWPKQNDQPTLTTFWSLPGVQCQSRLREMSPTADPLTRTYRARFTLIDPPADIKLGMTVTVSLDQSGSIGALDVPAGAIIRTNGQPAVWRIETDGSLTATPVQIAYFGTDSVRIASGLNVGDRIVSAGAHKLDANVRVRTWEVQK